MLEGKAVHVVDTKADPEMRLTVGSGFANVRTVLGVPMLREGTPTGVLVLTRSTVVARRRPLKSSSLPTGSIGVVRPR